MNLFERMQSYEVASSPVLLHRLPIIVRSNIRNYFRLIRKLSRPYDSEMMRILQETMFLTVKDLEGAVFSYQQHGEISFILRQLDEDSNSPYSGDIQEISSIVSSLITSNFLKQYMASDDPPDLVGEGIFRTRVFNTPSISEAANYLLGQQFQCQKSSVSIIAEDEFSKMPNITNLDFLNRRSFDEKKLLLETECNISFDEDYKNFFKYGSCAYKTTRVFNNVQKKKWSLDTTAPDFSNRDFLLTILKTGQDIFRPERDIQE